MLNDSQNNIPEIPSEPIPVVPMHEEQSKVEPMAQPPKLKKKKKHSTSWATIALAAIVGCGGGFAGGYLAIQNFGTKPTIVYQDVSTTQTATSTTQPTNVSSSTLSLQEIAAKASPSVVEILVEEEASGMSFFGQSYTAQGAGSGVIISEDGYILTNNHVVEDATTITVTDSEGTSYPATLIGTDSKSDIAVLKIDANDLTPATIGDSSTLAVGDTAVVIGNPLGTLGGTVTDGIISALDREVTISNQSMNLIQTNAAINSGNSGGGLFDAKGNLVGIVNAKDSGTTSTGATIEGLGFAIPINDAMDIAQELMTNGYVSNRATIGVYLQEIPTDTENYKAGLYITEIVPGSGAEAAGLQAYDRIIAADRNEISSYAELTKLLKTKSVGDTVDLTIVRDSKEMDVTVTLTGTIQEDK